MDLGMLIVDAAAAGLRLFFKHRYRLHVSGLDTLPEEGGLLILPNHPAELDPILISSQLWKHFRVRPVVLEKYYNLPVIHSVLRTIRSIPMPDMDFESGPYKRRRVEAALKNAIDALTRGENVLLYPSGRLMTGNRENVGGNSGAHTLLNAAAEAKVVLVRTRGLFGSIFSRAVSRGASPDFWPTVKRALAVIVRNGVFFVPKREVFMEFLPAPADFPRNAEVVTLNRWLNDWYNEPGPDGPTMVSYSFWKKDLPSLPPPPPRPQEISDVPRDISEKVTAKLAALTSRRKEEIHPQQSLGEDLGLDSLNIAELMAWLSAEFDVTDFELSEINSVGALLLTATGNRARSHEQREPPSSWHETGERPKPLFHPAPSIPATFLTCCARMKRAVAIADEKSGVVTWPRLKTAALLLAAHFKKLPGDRVGILLPASAGASLTVIAAMLARKIPVILNWTVGRRNLEHAVDTSRVEIIITSGAFLDRLDIDLSYLDSRFLLLEQMADRFGPLQKLTAFVQAKRSAAALRAGLGLEQINPDDPAVILFTSGSEAKPKGVPLSHRNILADIAGGEKVLEFRSSDVMLGFLPPFHSFGLTVNTVLPLITGLKFAYHPNPNESRKLAVACGKWGASMMAGTPTFLRGILRAGNKEHFRKLRIMISGADRAPAELFEQAQALGAKLIEGYGITECAPIVTVNRPEEERAGVGRPIEGVELLVVDHSTLNPLPEGERGLILIRGNNVFHGYLGGLPNPFVEVSGRRWYNSGDLGYLRGGCLFLSGRLKRFVKIGGEMISLPAIEDALSTKWGAGSDEPVLAVCSKENEDGSRPQIHLFASVAISLDEANQALRAAGIPSLAAINAVHQIEKIPLLGTGKVDIQQLSALL